VKEKVNAHVRDKRTSAEEASVKTLDSLAGSIERLKLDVDFALEARKQTDVVSGRKRQRKMKKGN
jgi:hypothetical protein